MNFFTRLQLLTFLMVYAPSAHAIMVKFGTKGGPIVPPTPEPVLPPSLPYRVPAPVWEERPSDTPDPNAHWRPQLFIPQPRYTHVVYNTPVSTQAPLNNAQRFVNAYRPQHQGINAQPVNKYFTPSQVLSSQSLPGFGIRYFVPTYANDESQEKYKQDDAQPNHIVSNEINDSKDSASDLQWKFEKDLAKRVARNTQERFTVPVYQWPAYVPSRHF